MRCLFIGGEADGTWREVGDAEERIYVSVRPPLSTVWLDRELGPFDQHVYIREQFHVGGKLFFIYRWSPIGIDTAFAALLTGYTKP